MVSGVGAAAYRDSWTWTWRWRSRHVVVELLEGRGRTSIVLVQLFALSLCHSLVTALSAECTLTLVLFVAYCTTYVVHTVRGWGSTLVGKMKDHVYLERNSAPGATHRGRLHWLRMASLAIARRTLHTPCSDF